MKNNDDDEQDLDDFFGGLDIKDENSVPKNEVAMSRPNTPKEGDNGEIGGNYTKRPQLQVYKCSPPKDINPKWHRSSLDTPTQEDDEEIEVPKNLNFKHFLTPKNSGVGEFSVPAPLWKGNGSYTDPTPQVLLPKSNNSKVVVGFVAQQK